LSYASKHTHALCEHRYRQSRV